MQDGRSERDKLDRRRSTKLTIPPSSDARPLVYHSDRQALSTARLRRAGQLATADACLLALYCSWTVAAFDVFTESGPLRFRCSLLRRSIFKNLLMRVNID